VLRLLPELGESGKPHDDFTECADTDSSSSVETLIQEPRLSGGGPPASGVGRSTIDQRDRQSYQKTIGDTARFPPK
jgi:hypothetical protein